MRRSTQCKHIVAVSLILALAAGMLLFTVPAQAQTKLTFMLWGQPKEWLPPIAEKLGYEIEWIVGGRSDYEVADKFRLALAANEGIPDIIQFNQTQIPEFGSAGVLVDLTKYFTPYMENLPEMVVEMISWDGRIVGFPYQIKTKQWYYRKDMFDEAGIDVAQIKTIDDFIAAGKKFQEKFPDSYLWNLGNQSIHYDFYGFVTAFDGRWNDEDGNYTNTS
jgi:ABC-type glycerol-3-phosphate transport system substrate-binding protein